MKGKGNASSMNTKYYSQDSDEDSDIQPQKKKNISILFDYNHKYYRRSQTSEDL